MFNSRFFGPFVVVFLTLFIYAQDVYAGNCSCKIQKNVAGTIQKIRLDISRIYIWDEDAGRVWNFFVHSNALKNFKEGERVHVYYESLGLPALSIKKMTPLEFDSEKQNQGYLFKSPSS